MSCQTSRRTGPRAQVDDLVQDVFVAAWRVAGGLSRDAGPAAGGGIDGGDAAMR
ncbi:MAG: sigma-70 family RNA polymerase sigma factor [Acidobacteria bacterium]|nr:sigma-70 family RNA polymerase sigma factor [Acidobacteriota bacterium]